MAQSSNDSFPSAMYIAAAVNVKQRLTSAVKALHDQIEAKVSSGKMSLRSAAPICRTRHHSHQGRSGLAMRACWRTICGGSKSIGYDKASKIAHYAMDNDLTLTGSVVTRAKSPETQLCDL